MYWLPWILPALGTGLVLAGLLRRRAELRGNASVLAERHDARRRGSAKAELQHPVVDLARCFGCGACVRACPEEGVLGMAYGQAVVVHGARCVGHARCVDVCPGGAIAVEVVDVGERRDLPAVDTNFEAVGVPGLFLAGELTGFALVRTAILHGAQVARAAARRVRATASPRRRRKAAARTRAARGGGVAVLDPPATAAAGDEPLDLLVVGMGPAGLSCALGAKQAGLRFHCLEQQPEIGGTVASYPRRKLVMTQPVELPLHGRLDRTTYLKEELVELWRDLVARFELPVTPGQTVKSVLLRDDGAFDVLTTDSYYRARNVVLALGRRGTPRRLGVPGEELTKVCYGLLDAEGFAGRRVLVVGGGDSAVEAALALCEQPDTAVTLSYRRDAFFRLKAKNEQRIAAAIEAGRVDARLGSQVARVLPDAVHLDERAADGTTCRVELANDDVIVLAGGTPPLGMLEQAGVSFDPELRPAQRRREDSNGVIAAFSIAFAGALMLFLFGLVHGDYYGTPPPQRQAVAGHDLLRPQGALGLWAGLAACGLFAANLLYLLRRSQWGRRLPGSLRLWMSAHVATGLLALLLVCLHCGFQVRDSVGGHALLVLLTVVLAGVVGRWLYAFVPRRQNGRQADLDELTERVAELAAEWDAAGAGFGAEVRQRVERLAAAEHWRRGLPSRIWGLLMSQVRLARDLRALRRQGAAAGVAPRTTDRVLALARRAHRLALQMARFDELRALAAGWRWLHRWLSLLLITLTALHVLAALRFGGVDFGVLFAPWGAP